MPEGDQTAAFDAETNPVVQSGDPPSSDGSPEAGYGLTSPPRDGWGIVTPGASARLGKTRSPVGVWLLALVTFGIYGLVWYYKINNELREYHSSIQVSPGLAVLSLFVPVVGWVSIYNTGKRIAQAQHSAGLGSTASGGLGLLATFFFSLHTVYYQGQLNRIWQVR